MQGVWPCIVKNKEEEKGRKRERKVFYEKGFSNFSGIGLCRTAVCGNDYLRAGSRKMTVVTVTAKANRSLSRLRLAGTIFRVRISASAWAA